VAIAADHSEGMNMTQNMTKFAGKALLSGGGA
jgi:hypothetical protein